MLKHAVVFTAAVLLSRGVVGLDGSSKPASMAGSWQVDNRFSDAQLTTDATTDYGKTKMNATLGFARINGIVKFDGNDPTKSTVDLTIYPATSISPSIDESGIFLSDWLASRFPHHTLVGFHSTRILRTADGRLQATGDLALTSVDRNVDAEMPSEGLSEADADPPPVVHRTTHEVTFVFDFPAATGNGLKAGNIWASGTTTVSREDFPQMVRTAVGTYWPPLIQDENCEAPVAREVHGGSRCTGTVLEAPALPEAPHAANSKEFHGSQNFNAIVGEHLTILVHLRLMPKAEENTQQPETKTFLLGAEGKP